MPLKMQIADSYDKPAWRKWLEELPEADDRFSNAGLIQGGRNQLYRCCFDDVDLVVKRFPNGGAWKKVVYSVFPGKGKRSYFHSERLIEAGLNTPVPVAWVESWKGSWLDESFYICRFTPFEHEAREFRRPELPERMAKARLLGQSLAQMHQSQILHLDLTPGNLLFTRNSEDGWELHIVDNNRMRFGPVSNRAAITSLLQADLPDDLVQPMLEEYAAHVRPSLEELDRAYRKSRQNYALKWRIKNATRPWRRKIGL